MRIHFLALFLFFGVITHANADILIEPMFGYNVGKFNTDFKVPAAPASNDTANDSVNGATYGGRLGFETFGLQFGLDYLAGNLKVDGDDTKMSELGGFIGYKFPVLLRIYAGYIFNGSAEGKAGTTQIKLDKGVGPKIGFGFALLSYLDLNFEWRNIKYEQYKGSTLGLDYTIDADYSAFMVGLSIPITF
jgi:hypothetical protein